MAYLEAGRFPQRTVDIPGIINDVVYDFRKGVDAVKRKLHRVNWK